jgi:hypothetical protein
MEITSMQRIEKSASGRTANEMAFTAIFMHWSGIQEIKGMITIGSMMNIIRELDTIRTPMIQNICLIHDDQEC